MNQHSFARPAGRPLTTMTSLVAATLLGSLAACGGDSGSAGGGGAAPTATVSSVTVAPTKYGQPALVTIVGSSLDSTLAVTSDHCSDMTLLTSGTNVSSSTTAYYSCTAHGGLTGVVVAKSNGTTVGQGSFTVAQPVVQLSVSNGSGGNVNGTIALTLRADVAPLTVDNFLHYVNTGFYDNTIFHRVVPGFVIQGGGYANPVTDLSTATPKAGLAAPIATEQTGLSNVAWSIAMANANTATNQTTTTSQFYFNVGDNTNLDGGNYAVFGSITGTTTVAQSILSAPAACTTSVVDTAGDTETDCLPTPNVVITSATQTQ